MLVFLAALCLASCDDYDDTSLWQKVNEHEERLAALEQWQEETNHNISAIQQLLNTTDCITAVTPLMEGGQEVGYTIQFLHSDPITIYHGTKGDTGHTPQIGLTQGEDNNWYWTLDGQLMQDADGNPIRANGEDGKDGEDGQDGADGEDGSDGATGAQGKPGTSAPTPQIMQGARLPPAPFRPITAQNRRMPGTSAWMAARRGTASAATRARRAIAAPKVNKAPPEPRAMTETPCLPKNLSLSPKTARTISSP